MQQYANAKEKDWCKKGHEDDRVARYIMQQTIATWIGVVDVQDVDDNDYYRDIDVDLVVDVADDNNLMRRELVEIKADDFPLVYNKARGRKEKFVFAETVSNDVKGTEGWLYTTQASYIIYMFMRYNRFVAIKTDALRNLVANNDYDVKTAKTFATDNKTVLYRSHGVVIPFVDIYSRCRYFNEPVITVQEAREILKIA